MSYGIIPTGFNIKRLPDIRIETETSFKNALGESINLSGETPLGQIKGVLDEVVSKVWELAEGVYYSQYPNSSEDVSLDNVVSITGISRLEATKSIIIGQLLYGDVSAVVPIGTILSVTNDISARFLTNDNVTLVAGGDEVQDIDFSAVPDEGSFKLKYNSEITAAINWNDTNTVIQVALNNLNALSEITVTGDFTAGFTITFQGEDGKQNHPVLIEDSNTLKNTSVDVVITIVETTPGIPQGEVNMTAENTGDTQANALSLIVIETPVSGLDSTKNPNDAILGRNKETDAELKIRREQTLQIAGNGTVEGIRSDILAGVENVTTCFVFENDTDEIVDSRPPHSIEILVQGGTDQNIADKIWEIKAAGIATHGSISKIVIDSMTNLHTIKFSRPTIIIIYIIVDVTTDSDFPGDGADQIKDAIVTYGDGLTVSNDIIVYPKLMASFAEVLGITDVTSLKVGTSYPPTTDDNIIIADTELADIQKTNITVNIT